MEWLPSGNVVEQCYARGNLSVGEDHFKIFKATWRKLIEKESEVSCDDCEAKIAGNVRGHFE